MKLSCSVLLIGAVMAAPALAQGEDPSFSDLIRRSSYLQSLGEKAASSQPAAAAPAAASPGSDVIATARAAEKAGNFREAADIVKRELEKSPWSAKLRYYYAYIFYSASQKETDPILQERLLERARQETYRVLDLVLDKRDAENPRWVSSAEVLLDRIQGPGVRPIPPVHGRLLKPYSGQGGILIGSVYGPDNRPLYNIAGKPIASFGEGYVLDAGRDRNLGLIVRIRYKDTLGNPFVVEYGNLADTNGLKPGQAVNAATIVGHVANSAGRDEPALYLEIKREGRSYDPSALLLGKPGREGDRF